MLPPVSMLLPAVAISAMFFSTADELLPPCCAARVQDAASAPALAAISDNAPTSATDESVEALLSELEAAAADLQAFTADVQYVNIEDLLGRQETRIGELIYRVDPVDGSKSFAVMFNRVVIGDRAQNQAKHYIFADRWLAEVDHENKQFISREIVPPGRELDPLKLGEGPIPLPIGQPKDEVLARFDVSRIDVPETGILAGLDNVDGLRLVPKEGAAEASDYQHVDLFYDRASRLPVGISTLETNDNRKVVRLRQLQHNPKLTEEQLELLSIETPDPAEWAIDRRPWRGDR